MILRKGQLPAAVRGHRILVKPAPPIQESDVIIKPEAYEYLPNKGTLIAAGLTAMDVMHDHDVRLGDEIWWGKFAGVIEEWDHIEDEGKDHEHTWTARPSGHPRNRKWACECKATRIAEHMLVMNVDDILADVTAQRRIENGLVEIRRGKTADGRTQHHVVRKDE